MEIFVDFGLFELLAVLGLAKVAKKLIAFFSGKKPSPSADPAAPPATPPTRSAAERLLSRLTAVKRARRA